MPCAEHRAGDRGDGVGVPAEGRRSTTLRWVLSKKRVAMANAAATDSLASTLVPQSRRRMVANSPSDMEPSSLMAHSMNIFTRATTDALADQLPRGGWDSTNANAFERKPLPRDGEAHGGGHQRGHLMPCMVLCVTTQERQASSVKAFPGMKAMPTGRMAPPFVVPNCPVSSGLDPFRQRLQSGLGGWAEQVQRALSSSSPPSAGGPGRTRRCCHSAMVFDEAGGQHERPVRRRRSPSRPSYSARSAVVARRPSTCGPVRRSMSIIVRPTCFGSACRARRHGEADHSST